MKYQIGIRTLSAPPAIEITEKVFKELQAAKEGIVTVILMEEAFDAIIENYLEFENTLLEATTRYMVLHAHHDYATFQRNRMLFNRRLMNLLTTSQSYKDQTCHYLSGLFSDQGILEKVRAARRAEYGCRLGFRAMEMLRNYVQHRGISVHGVTYGGYWESQDDEKKARLRFTVTAYLRVDELRTDPKHQSGKKAEIIAELPHKDGQCDLRPLIREYIAGLSTAHKTLRAEMKPHVDGWVEKLLSAEKQVSTTLSSGESLIGLSAFEIDNRGVATNTVGLPPSLRERLRELQRRDGPHSNLPKFFVSSEIE